MMDRPATGAGSYTAPRRGTGGGAAGGGSGGGGDAHAPLPGGGQHAGGRLDGLPNGYAWRGLPFFFWTVLLYPQWGAPCTCVFLVTTHCGLWRDWHGWYYDADELLDSCGLLGRCMVGAAGLPDTRDLGFFRTFCCAPRLFRFLCSAAALWR